MCLQQHNKVRKTWYNNASILLNSTYIYQVQKALCTRLGGKPLATMEEVVAHLSRAKVCNEKLYLSQEGKSVVIVVIQQVMSNASFLK